MTKLVFLWTGKSPLPSYAFDSLKLNHNNSNTEINIILSADNFSLCKHQIALQLPNLPIKILCLDEFYIRDQRLHELTFCGPLDFRNGFWLHTYERTLVLIEYFLASGLSFFHSELDNICFCLDRLESRLACLQVHNPCFARDHHHRAVLSLAYFQNRESLIALREYLLSPRPTSIRNDMHDLGSFINDNPEQASSFPLEQAFLHTNESSKWSSLPADSLQGICDANTIGQYIFGVDIANCTRVRNGFVNENALIQPRLLNYKINYFTKNRCAITLAHESYSYNLYNIHIHSKAMGILLHPYVARTLFVLLNLRIYIPVFNLHSAKTRLIRKSKKVANLIRKPTIPPN